MSNNKMEKWNTLANQALPVANTAKESSEEKKNLFASLSFLSLQILLEGKIQDEIALTKAVSKQGQFHSLRQVVSKARPLADMVNNDNQIVIVTPKGEVTGTYTKQDIIKADMPLFSVATAYSLFRASQEKIEKILTDKDFIELALEALPEQEKGLTVAEVMNMTESTKQGFVSQGKAIHGEKMKAIQHEQNLQSLESLQNAFLTLDKQTQEDFASFVLNQVRPSNKKAA